MSGGDATDEQVDLASQAEGEDGVEEGGDERSPDGDLAEHGGTGEEGHQDAGEAVVEHGDPVEPVTAARQHGEGPTDAHLGLPVGEPQQDHEGEDGHRGDGGAAGTEPPVPPAG